MQQPCALLHCFLHVRFAATVSGHWLVYPHSIARTEDGGGTGDDGDGEGDGDGQPGMATSTSLSGTRGGLQ